MPNDEKIKNKLRNRLCSELVDRRHYHLGDLHSQAAS